MTSPLPRRVVSEQLLHGGVTIGPLDGIPDRNRSAAADPGQLAEAFRRVGIEHHPELAGRHIELAGAERQILSIPFHVLDGTTMTTRHSEHGGIDIDPDHPASRAASDGSGQRPRTARDVDDLIGRFDQGRVRDCLGEPAEERGDE
jgi:hypothetical protein